ncbi:MAG: hypothetical protein ACJAT2_002110 [Bacteriovoracaceae bacterium]|jgi:hypothetical protein
MLVSLDPETNRPPLRSRNWDINEKLEKVFLKKLKKENLDLVILPFARQDELRAELLNPNNHAIFWVGHSNAEAGLAAAGIYDDQGFNMKELFQEVHQNIKFLGLVGCQALPFVESLKNSPYWKLNSHLTTYAREKRVDARKGLKRAIKAFINSEEGKTPTCEEREVIQVRVSRTSDQELSSARIIRKGQLVGTFEKNQEETTIELPLGLKKSELKLVLESGAPNNTKTKFNLGKLEFTSENESLNWKLFADREGNPLGFGSHVYRFTGNLKEELQTRFILPKQCLTNN